MRRSPVVRSRHWERSAAPGSLREAGGCHPEMSEMSVHSVSACTSLPGKQTPGCLGAPSGGTRPVPSPRRPDLSPARRRVCCSGLGGGQLGSGRPVSRARWGAGGVEGAPRTQHRVAERKRPGPCWAAAPGPEALHLPLQPGPARPAEAQQPEAEARTPSTEAASTVPRLVHPRLSTRHPQRDGGDGGGSGLAAGWGAAFRLGVRGAGCGVRRGTCSLSHRARF